MPPQPSTEKYPKINKNSKINPTQNQQKPKINPTLNQQKPKNQPNSKPIKTHRETQPKNSPHPPENPAQWSRIYRPICCHCYRRVFHCCRWIFHCCHRLEVGGEGSIVEERGRAKAKGRPNQLMAEAAAAATSWISELGVSWVDKLGVSEGKRETGKWAERENGWGKREMSREREKETVLITNNKKNNK